VPKNSYKLAINVSEIKGSIGFNSLVYLFLAIKKYNKGQTPKIMTKYSKYIKNNN
jgi:hypothetical protein